MGLLKAVRNSCNDIIEKSYSMGQYYGEVRKIKNENRQRLISTVHWTAEQENEFKQYWKKNYGKEISSAWHKLYQSYTGKFNVRYFPEYLFSSKLEPLFDKNPYNDALEDKNLLHLYTVGGVRTPRIFYSRCNGLFRDENYIAISEDEFMKGLHDIGEVVIKPTVESGSGRGVRFVRLKNGVDVFEGETLEEVLRQYGKMDIAIQECVKPAESLKSIYPYAINTFRIMTYILDEKIYACPAVLRIGRNGKRLDNAHAGGMFVGVSPNGQLAECAYTESGEHFTSHPDTNAVFADCKIERVPLLVDACKKMHAITPQLGTISWDVTLNNNNEVELLEINTRGGGSWLPQMANGEPLFGEDTEKLLSLIRK